MKDGRCQECGELQMTVTLKRRESGRISISTHCDGCGRGRMDSV